ncbi:MAG: hypothetical protein IPJ98_23845 [Bryobacterales bacterium]|nr:hypothetical protein [Bryobacterales bacterium]
MSGGNTSKPAISQPVLIISTERKLKSALIPVLSQELPMAPLVELAQMPDRRLIAEMASGERPSLIFLDVSNNREGSLEALHQLSQGLIGVPVVVILHGNDPDLIMRCLRSGASEFLLQPVTGDQLQPVLARLVMRKGESALSGGARVQVVMPAKGACGASTLASNLAFHWKRHGFKRVMLADFDPLTGTIPFLLKLKPVYSFVDALTREGGLDSDIWRGLVTKHNDVDVLLSPENPIDVESNNADPAALFQFARQAYDIITVDSPGPFGSWATSLVNLADEVLLVTTNELPALRATQRVLQGLDRMGVDRAKVKLIVNRYSSEVGLNQEAIETALHSDVFHVLPSDYDAVQAALVEGKPIASSTPIGKSLVQLADRLAGKRSTAVEQTKKKSSIGSLFSGLLSRG